MRAKNLLLTHFSQRYPKIPDLEQLSLKCGLHIAVAFDMMRVPLIDFYKLAHYYPAFSFLFEEKSVDEKEDNLEATKLPTESK